MTDASEKVLGQVRTGWVIATKSNLKLYADVESNEPKAFEVQMICTSTVAADGPDTTWAIVDRATLPDEYFAHRSQPPVPYPCKTEAAAWTEFLHAVSDQMSDFQGTYNDRLHELRTLRQFAYKEAQRLSQPLPKKMEPAHANA